MAFRTVKVFADCSVPVAQVVVRRFFAPTSVVLGKFAAKMREAVFSLSRRVEGAERAQRLRRNVDRGQIDHDISRFRPKGGKSNNKATSIFVEKLANTTLTRTAQT